MTLATIAHLSHVSSRILSRVGRSIVSIDRAGERVTPLVVVMSRTISSSERAPRDGKIDRTMARRQLADEAFVLIGLEVQRLREELGLSQRQLSQRIGVGQNIVSDLEVGKRRPNKYLGRLAVVFGVETSRFAALVEPCAHCGGTGLRHWDQSRASTLRRALLRARPKPITT